MSDRPIIKIAPADLPSDMNIEERLVFLGDQVASLTAAPTIVSLSRIPSPKITSGLTSNGTGVQFTFSQLSLSGIDGYRVYRNSSNSFVGATQLQYLKHSALLTTSVTVVDTIPAGTAEYYWVTAVGTSGLESAPTAAQAASVTSGSIVDSVGNLKLKNVSFPFPSASSPTTTSASYVLIPEMSTGIITHGNPVLILFNGQFSHSLANSQITFAVFANGSQTGNDFLFVTPPTASVVNTFSASMLIGTSNSGSSVYDMRWKVAGGTATAFLTNRTMAVIEF